MYLVECENLARKYPDLNKIIKRIDKLLSDHSPSSYLRVDDIAKHLDENRDNIEIIFKKLEEQGILRHEFYIECSECGNLMDESEYRKSIEDEDSFECSLCQEFLSIKNTRELKIFRLNVPKIKRVQKEKVKIRKNQKNATVILNFDKKIPKSILNNPFEHTPLLQYYSNDKELLKDQLFIGTRFLILLHFLRDLIPFLKALQNVGFEFKNSYFFYKDYPYPQKESIRKWLVDQGSTVDSYSKINSYLDPLSKSSEKRIGKIIIIEDGGMITPRIHKKFPNLIKNTIGSIEQTTRGIFNAQELEKIEFPIISVATSGLKNKFEPPYIAEATINNFQRMFPNLSLKGRKISIFGYGTIGQEISEKLRNIGANVSIFDKDENKLLIAKEKGFNTCLNAEDCAKNDIIIGASGRTSIDFDVITNLKHGSFLISASSEQYEIDLLELEKLQNEKNPLKNDSGYIVGTEYKLNPDNRLVNLIANGYPINFWGFDSMPEQASDLILTLILLSTIKLASCKNLEKKIDTDFVNKVADSHEVAKRYLGIHR